MAIWGADVDQLKVLGTKLQAGAQEIDNQRSILTKVLAGTQWLGPDADKFRNEWNGEHVANLSRISQALQQASQQANRNASDQEGASTR
ncbi:hypothetical protein [Arthrobacter sp. Soil763]|uniref:hypothetical protein n=1 Tax=Arthrobacter sp. Soil763 TaxID=1736402 RepID=UPI0006FB180D|nr:hypothetical protein [Arthrobacter sp. Soil763]KRE77431.1 hypothetical protein ASG71_14085 [Arthrobacter sp. Soil763]KRE81999.1 hypothetical protein ASG71_02835 [Arthrobacter sp. Soil763]